MPMLPRSSKAAAILPGRLGLSALILLAFAAPALAQPSPVDVTMAETLFREGKALLEQGKFDEACPKLAESQRIDPAGGTLLTLAICYEAAGKTASAWGVYNEALAVAEKQGRADRVKRSKEAIAALEKRLSYVTVKAAPEVLALEGLVIERDEKALARVALGVAVPLDPGKHSVVAKAPGWKPAVIEIDVGPSGDRKVVEIPLLQKEEPPPAPDPSASVEPPPPTASVILAPPPPGGQGSERGSGQRHVGIGIASFGVASVVVGSIVGLRAKSLHDKAIERCPGSPCPDAEGVRLNEDAQTNALISNLTFGAGLALVGAGVVVWLTAPRAESDAPALSAARLTHIRPVIGSSGAALSLGGTF
jgi:hypothetical protein